MTGFTIGGAGLVTGLVPAAVVVTAGAAAGCLLGVVGVTQLGVSLRRRLGG
jgi:CDP-diacylglycerol--glycerol-3-phosphate 3-phosphatidyltransferase